MRLASGPSDDEPTIAIDTRARGSRHGDLVERVARRRQGTFVACNRNVSLLLELGSQFGDCTGCALVASGVRSVANK